MEGDGVGAAAMAAPDGTLFGRLDVPEADGGIDAGGGELLAIGAEGQTGDAILVTGQRSESSHAFAVVEADDGRGSGREAAAVGAEGERMRSMPQRADEFARGPFVEADLT